MLWIHKKSKQNANIQPGEKLNIRQYAGIDFKIMCLCFSIYH